MKRLVRKTIRNLVIAVVVMDVVMTACLCLFSYWRGAASGYALGKDRADADSRFQAYIDHGEPFIWEPKGSVVYPAKRVIGRRAPYYIINSEK